MAPWAPLVSSLEPRNPDPAFSPDGLDPLPPLSEQGQAEPRYDYTHERPAHLFDDTFHLWSTRSLDPALDGSGGRASPQLVRRGDSVGDRLKPSHTQVIDLYVIGGYAVFILIAWNLWGLRHILYPFKLLTVAFHEAGHAMVGCCTGARIESITLDPNEGGATRMRGGIPCCTLPAGYLGSSLIGALLIFCGFNIVASKIASIVVGVIFLATLWWARRDLLTIAIVIAAVGLIVGFWFIKHGVALRYLMLFIGVMSCLYSVWDIMDDLIFRKVNESDASQFAKLCPAIPSQVWGVIWLFISLIFLAAGILCGLAAFKQSESKQEDASEDFLPTKMFMAI